MTLQIETPKATVSNANDFESLPFGVLLGGWNAAREITCVCPTDSLTVVEPVDDEAPATEINIFGPQVGLRNKISAYRARRRLNRSFRRNQREFEGVLDAVAHDPAGQRELKAIWTIGS